MSLETWKDEFYPVPADKVEAKDAVAHSLRKWIGLRKENLERHGVVRRGFMIHDKNYTGKLLPIDDQTCALCVHYEGDDCKCTACPLQQVRKKRCDRKLLTEYRAPYLAFIHCGDPEPMIQCLEAAAAHEAAKATTTGE